MTLLRQFTPSLSSSRLRPSPPSLSFSFNPIFSSSRRRPITVSVKVPARDRVIDFGRHKGRMLGTLPSKYLTWISKNLRARDFEEWAKLADEVIQDPVYRDRMEWELAERVLSGEGMTSAAAAAAAAAASSSESSPVSALLEISERFGWDNEDKAGWSRIDFGLLGTSKGGRIPRKAASSGGGSRGVSEENGEIGFEGKGWGLRKEKKVGFFGGGGGSTVPVSMGEMGSLKKTVFDRERGMEFPKERKVGFFSKGQRVVIEEEGRFEEEMMMGKREERRERQRVKRVRQLRMLRREVGVAEDGATSGGGGGIGMKKKQIGGSGRRSSSGSSNPFPGRGALLDRIHNKKPEPQ